MQLEFSEDNLVEVIVKVLLPALKEKLEVPDDLLTAQQVNDKYYHIGNDAIGAVIHQKGFPKTEIPGKTYCKYSRKAVEKFIADHQTYQH